MESDLQIDEWIEWLHIIEKDIYELLMLRYVYLEVKNIVDANPKIQTDGYFYQWLGITYSKTASIGVRRQVDARLDVISLGRLLADIQHSPEILSLARFESMYTKDYNPNTEEERLFYNLEQTRAEEEFRQFSGKVQVHVDPSSVSNDLIQLRLTCQPIVKYVNKRVAHRDEKHFTTYPTYPELDRAIDHLSDVLKKYELLIRGVLYDGKNVTPQWDWKEVFKMAWIEKV